MSSKKLKNVLFTFGIGLTLIAVVLFIVTPLIAGTGFSYNGPQALLAGLKTIISFNFNDAIYVLFFFLTVISIVIVIAWLVILGRNDAQKAMPRCIVGAIFLLAIFVLLFTYFATPITFNEKDITLFNGILEVQGEQKLGVLLSMASLALLQFSLMFLTLFGFLDIYQAIVIEEAKTVVIQEASPAIEEVEKEPEETDDDRKPREEKLFQELINTGNYTEYDEYELPEPIEGVTEEPVLEEITVEETSKFTHAKTYVNKGVRKDNDK